MSSGGEDDKLSTAVPDVSCLRILPQISDGKLVFEPRTDGSPGRFSSTDSCRCRARNCRGTCCGVTPPAKLGSLAASGGGGVTHADVHVAERLLPATSSGGDVGRDCLADTFAVDAHCADTFANTAWHTRLLPFPGGDDIAGDSLAADTFSADAGDTVACATDSFSADTGAAVSPPQQKLLPSPHESNPAVDSGSANKLCDTAGRPSETALFCADPAKHRSAADACAANSLAVDKCPTDISAAETHIA